MPFRMRQLWKRNSPTFLIRAFLAHEVIGRIEEVVWRDKRGRSTSVSEFGFFGGEDGTCEASPRGETAYCANAIMTASQLTVATRK